MHDRLGHNRMNMGPSVPRLIPTKKSPSSQPLQYFAKVVMVFGLYFAVGKLGLLVPFTSNNVSPIWPASGLALAAVLLWGYRIWPGIAAAAFAVNFSSQIPWTLAVGIAVGNTSSAILGGYLFHRLGGLQPHLPTLRDILNLVIYAYSAHCLLLRWVPAVCTSRTCRPGRVSARRGECGGLATRWAH